MGDLKGGQWEELMTQIEKNYQGKEQLTSDLASLFFNLTKVLEKKAALHWHIQSMERYISEHINPIGLRIQIFPILNTISKELKSNWEARLDECSKNLMQLLQNEYRQQLQVLDKEIEALYINLTPLKSLEEYANLEQKLKEHLETFSKSILIKKEKKYWRDKNAFREGRAYKWDNIKRFRNQNPKKNSKIDGTHKDYSSDTPSNSSSSMSSNTGRIASKRKGASFKQNLEGEVKQANKKAATVPQLSLVTNNSRKKTTPSSEVIDGDTKDPPSSRSRLFPKKDSGAIPKTQRTALDNFLDKRGMPAASPNLTIMDIPPALPNLNQEEV